MLTGVEFIKSIVEEKPTLAQRILDTIRNILDKIKKLWVKAIDNMDTNELPDIKKFLMKSIPSTEEIEENKNKIAQMNPVTELEGNEFGKNDRSLLDNVDDYFKTNRNALDIEHVGELHLNKTGIKADIAHGIGRKKAIGYMYMR